MQLRPAVLAALVAAAHALPQSEIPDVDFENLSCIGECFINDATPDWISGECEDRDVLDDDYADCVCDSIKADPFYDCILKCPKDQRDEYQKSMNDACPNLFSSGGGDKDDDNESAAKADDDNDNDDNDDDSGSSQDSGSDRSSATNDSADDDEDEDDAAIRNGPALLAAVAAVAAFVL
ncbi:hypothetical protein ACRE_003640 [Hapsidospora chrysogenum ATCC 11550]|uniref:Uncharacterized protein n=1 Tax=Hapsidospora chrysogenum (strain ATCC 11550 / CBS 779.69 / DSM 880 / IAM 14645 / JCM 23072 / IMI 49137) TaxID=857340 RepID=A0A086THG2_HAPC1|nr:hypothetical protein ACRE_003640 [Hapsidospora chrysogenum ATCC 11550]